MARNRASIAVLALVIAAGAAAADATAGRAAVVSRAGTPIAYHGGPVMAGDTQVFIIWYGNWTGAGSLTIVPTFLGNLAPSPYYNINTTYSGTNGRVKNELDFGGAITDHYSHGSHLSDADVLAVVTAAITSGKLPNTVDGIYFVVTSVAVTETSGFCTQYCGWHDFAPIGGTEIKYSFLGDPQQCPSACEAIPGNDPNGDPTADAIIGRMAFEVNVTVTDPQFTGWFDASGAENADKCGWSLGTTYRTANGSLANVHLGSHDYLLPENWVNVSPGRCALHYP
jgi:hypothetical protein